MNAPSTIFDHYRPELAGRFAKLGSWLGQHWFRFSIEGLENIPKGPCLVVANHSGFGIVEELLFASTWHEHFPNRRAWGLIHDMFFTFPVLGAYYRAIGAIPASPENARAAFERGEAVLVFPGGDLDCCRPFYEADRVHFGDRRGYIRLAMEQGIPIVPLATSGSHWTWTFLPGGRTLASIPWVRQTFRTDCVPLPTALFALLGATIIAAIGLDPWWTVAIVALLTVPPTPVTIRSTLGKPIHVANLRNSPNAVERGHEEVWGWLQTQVAAGVPHHAGATVEQRPH